MRTCPVCKLEYRDDHDTCLVDGATLVELADPRLGTLVGGRYVLESLLGEGGMATVYRARHTLIERPLAVKVLHKHLAHDSTLRERFRREAKSAATIAHENVIEIYDFGETEDGCPFLVMELLEGDPLRKVIERGAMPASLVCELGVQLARGLARAHDLGIAHRDLKPENVFVTKRADGTWLAKLVDFGIAQSKKEARLTARGSLIGTPQYLAPERIKGMELGAPSDLYSFGVLLFEMLTGRPPFVSQDLPGYLIQHMEARPPAPSSLVAGCPDALERLILQLLEKEPKDRPVDMHQVVAELEALCRTLVPDSKVSLPVARTTPSTVKATPVPPVTLELFERRLLLFQQMLRRGFPEAPPPAELVGAVNDIENALDRLKDLRAERLGEQQKLDQIERDSREARERLGHAVHELGVDLSGAREAMRAAEEVLAARAQDVKDVEYQLEALRGKLRETEANSDGQRSEIDLALKRSGDELLSLERDLDERSRAFVATVRENPRVAPLLTDDSGVEP